MVEPELASDSRQVHMIRSRISAPKELSPGDTLLYAVCVFRTYKHLDVFRHHRVFRATDQNVENRLGRQTRNRGASGVFDLGRKTSGCEVFSEPLGLQSKEFGPGRIVRHNSNCPTLQA